MSNVVLQCSQAEIKKMMDSYSSYVKPTPPPGAIFAAKTPTCNITAYKSGKVLFQGGGAATESIKWNGIDSKSTPSKPKTNKPLPEQFSSLSVIGSDEVGTGDFFGPMTVVSAYAKKEQLPLLKELGVKDSKHLKDDQIVKIAKDIISVIPYSLLILPNPKYNELQAKGMTQGKIKAILHNQVLVNLHKKIHPEKPDAVLIDQFAEEGVYFRHIQKQPEILRENVYFSTKAEGVHLSVAAASILARYAFLKEWDKLSQVAGFTLPKGAGKQVDEAAAKIILSKGTDVLKTLTKHHFANTGKAIAIASKRKNQ